MHLVLNSKLIKLGSVLLMLTACSQKPEAEPAPTEALSAVAIESQRVPAREPTPPPAKLPWELRSDQAPFACDVLTEEEVKSVFAADVEILDVTKGRTDSVPVQSSCLYSYGSSTDFRQPGAKFVRVDILTDESLQAREWGQLQDHWMHRIGDDSNRFSLMPDVWAAWVDSEHPPDPALVLRMGDVMFELAYWPPTSSRGSPEANGKIEALAKILVERILESHEQ